MNRSHLAIALSLAIGLMATHVDGAIPAAVSENEPLSPVVLDLHYHDGLIGGRIEHVPLGRVLRKLAFKTGMQFKLTEPSFASFSISVRWDAISIDQAIKQILRGFSFMLYRASNTMGVIVLSTPPRPSSTSGLIRDGHTNTYALAEPMPPQPNSEPKPAMVAGLMPQSLDELAAIPIEAASSDDESDSNENRDPSVRLAREQEYQEALLNRALIALRSEHQHLYEEAIDQLGAINDPRAVQALIDAIEDRDGLDRNMRRRAVEALWQHATNTKFSDVNSIQALGQLSDDNDENIRNLAHQALKEMEHYQNSAQ
jgi:HEAT repeats